MSSALIDRELRSSGAMATATALPNNKLLISSPGKSHHHNNNHPHSNNNNNHEQAEPASPSSSAGGSPRAGQKRSRKAASTPDAAPQSNGVAHEGSPQPPPPPPPPPAKRRRHHAASSAGQPANPNIRDDMFRNYQPWVIATYGDSAKTKTITLRKHARILRTLRGEETNSVENSKFRFWVKAKGFRMGRPPGYVPKPADSIVGTQALPGQSPHDEPPLYVPVATAKDGMGRERQLFKKVAVVENFFDIIFSVHVEMEGRAGKHAGQKRTYRAITETYAFLPREAVTRFLLGCTDCQRRPRSPSPAGCAPQSSPQPASRAGSPAPAATAAPSPACSPPPPARSPPPLPGAAPAPPFVLPLALRGAAEPPPPPPRIDFSMPITTTYLKHMRSLGYSDEDALRIDVDCLDGGDSEKTGDSLDDPITECNVTPDLVDEGDPAKDVAQPTALDSNSYGSTPERETLENAESKPNIDVDHARDELLALLRSVNQNYSKRDHLSSFGDYICDKIRSFNSTHLQSVAQMRIQQVLFDLEMESQTQHLMSGLLTSPPYFSSPIARNSLFSANPCPTGTASPSASRISTPKTLCFASESSSLQQQQMGQMFQPLSTSSVYQHRK